MPEFETYIMRHGEFGVQAIVEKLERYEGVRNSIDTSLEDRWNLLMNDSPHYRLAA